MHRTFIALTLTVALAACARTEAAPTRMTPDASKKLVRDFVETVKNGRKLDKLADYFAPDYVEHNAVVASFGKGVDGYKAFLGHLFAAFPDDKVAIDQIVGDGEWVSYRATESGTHKGVFLKIPATQKAATWTEIQFFRIKDGKIVEHWVDVDLFSWFQQLGIIPKMG
jgi:steroid delta-isomerase-like uncharacterized protein